MFIVIAIIVLGYLPSNGIAEIYRWVDENGRVHYGDKAASRSANGTVEKQTQPSTPAADTNERADRQQKVLESFRYDREQAQDRIRAEKERKALYARNCSVSRKRLMQIEQAQYLYRSDANGERVIYTEAERSQWTQRARREVANWCN